MLDFDLHPTPSCWPMAYNGHLRSSIIHLNDSSSRASQEAPPCPSSTLQSSSDQGLANPLAGFGGPVPVRRLLSLSPRLKPCSPFFRNLLPIFRIQISSSSSLPSQYFGPRLTINRPNLPFHACPSSLCSSKGFSARSDDRLPS